MPDAVAHHKMPRFVPAEEPSTYMSGRGLVLLAEFSRPVTVVCQACKLTTLKLKLLSNSVLKPATCERLLTEHLDGLGWSRLRDGGADICPSCAGDPPEVCELCRGYGRHHPTCPTLLPDPAKWARGSDG